MGPRGGVVVIILVDQDCSVLTSVKCNKAATLPR